ncbi:PEELING CUPREDOXIN putative-RELATED [Salix purpurea]|uniref:PEELING CUPREDOXIN putative-RELATED n=1 Tax=Salix purpurea TaxID=77065 RepID=A0A9Q0UKP8_SALPP|nr:PEELING CUPREDOXIN putative-RELATED [Salix purpurea]
MGSKLIVFVVLGVASLLLHSSKATDYEVGDSTGWKAPSDSSFYSTWASGKTFTVGDTLKFTFATGVHDVATVSKSDYDSCNIAGQSNVSTTGPTTITLSAPGHFLLSLCTFSDHCSRGQKLSITVVASSTPSTPLRPLTTRYTAYSSIFLSIFLSTTSIIVTVTSTAAIALSFLESRCYLGFGVYVHCHKFHALLVVHVTVAVFWCFAIQHRCGT